MWSVLSVNGFYGFGTEICAGILRFKNRLAQSYGIHLKANCLFEFRMKNVFSMLFLSCTPMLMYGCASTQPKVMPESPACINYRGMMTAPMAPDAMQRLKQDCEDSKLKANK
jgi:hypothetical protein